MSPTPPIQRVMFGTPARWALGVLAWMAFGVTAYLAWHAVGQTAVFGCEMGSGSGCDAVLASSWSKWLGVPIAVAGLACYATLAGLSVLLGVESWVAARWIRTGFVMLAIIAAGASLWFIAVQFVVIRQLCPYCLVTDACGLALGTITAWSVGRWFLATQGARRAQSSATNLMALRTAMPGGTAAGTVPRPSPPTSPAPSLPLAIGGAVAILAVLLTGQIVFPARTYNLQSVTLEKPVALAGSSPTKSADHPNSADAGSYVANRIPVESDTGDSNTTFQSGENLRADDSAFPGDPANTSPREAPTASDSRLEEEVNPPPAMPPKERLIEFLNGKLRLDVYKHPLLGSPTAPHVMVEMVSYDCPHCRHMHRIVKKGLERYGDQLAIVVMPIPMEMGCNRLVTSKEASHRGACTTARMALGIAAIRPDLFPEFHDWLMADKEKPPLTERVVTKAYNMVDSTRLSKYSSGQVWKDRVAEYIDLFAQLQSQSGGSTRIGLPVQILGDHIMTGMADKESDVFDAWEEHLGVKQR